MNPTSATPVNVVFIIGKCRHRLDQLTRPTFDRETVEALLDHIDRLGKVQSENTTLQMALTSVEEERDEALADVIDLEMRNQAMTSEIEALRRLVEGMQRKRASLTFNPDEAALIPKPKIAYVDDITKALNAKDAPKTLPPHLQERDKILADNLKFIEGRLPADLTNVPDEILKERLLKRLADLTTPRGE